MTQKIEVTGFNDYQIKALRTLNERGQKMNVLHCILGMTGEIGELFAATEDTKDKIIKEFGDCTWYTSVLCWQFDLPFDELYVTAMNDDFNNSGISRLETMMACSALAESIKKSIFYDTDLDKDVIIGATTLYMRSLLHVADKYEVDILEALARNINKLFARFPEKFDEFLAVNRNEALE